MRFHFVILFVALIGCASAQYRFGDIFRRFSGRQTVVPQVPPVPTGVGSQLASALNGIVPFGLFKNTIAAVGDLLDGIPSDIMGLPKLLANSKLSQEIQNQVVEIANNLREILEIISGALSNPMNSLTQLLQKLAAIVPKTLSNIFDLKMALMDLGHLLPNTWNGLKNLGKALLTDLNPFTAISNLFSSITSLLTNGGLSMMLNLLGLPNLNSLTGGLNGVAGLTGLVGNLGPLLNALPGPLGGIVNQLGGAAGLSTLAGQLAGGNIGGLLGQLGGPAGLANLAGQLGGAGGAGGLANLAGQLGGAGGAGGLANLAGQLGGAASGGAGGMGGTAGSLAGGAAGAALGSVGGPLGTMAGQKAGSMAGEALGRVGAEQLGNLGGKFGFSG